MISFFHPAQWFVDTILAWWVGAVSVVPLAALAAYGLFLYRHRFPPHTDQLTWLYVYFVPVGEKFRLVLSTQEHFPDAESVLSHQDFLLLRHYERTASAGAVIRIAKKHSQQLIGNLANKFWAKTCGPGQLARSQGLLTCDWMVMVCLMATPANGGTTSKHRVVIVPLRWLDELPTIDQVEPSPAMSQSKMLEWLNFLRDMVAVRQEEGDDDPNSARINEMVITTL